MTEITKNLSRKRHPSVAIIFSLIIPGIGHIYCGKLLGGLLLVFLYSTAIPILLKLLAYMSPNWTISIAMAASATLLGILIVAAIDSYRIARSIGRSYELKEYNRWYVYVFLALIIQGGLLGHLLHIRARYIEALISVGNSCYPTIMLGDRHLMNRIAYKNQNPQRGDLVILNPPNKWRFNYIKRVVAVEGDTVERKNYELYINGQKLKREKLPPSTLNKIRLEPGTAQGDVFYEFNGSTKYKIFLAQPPYGNEPPDFGLITVPKGHCFVLGDNRNRSLDSFNFGPVSLATVKGRIEYLYWPAKDWSRFGRMSER